MIRYEHSQESMPVCIYLPLLSVGDRYRTLMGDMRGLLLSVQHTKEIRAQISGRGKKKRTEINAQCPRHRTW